MKSTGNDIVALNAIDIKRTISPAFYSKIITIAEIELCRQPALRVMPLQNFVWLLWSVKESTYKYLQRINPRLIFSPGKIAVSGIEENDNNYTGEVIYNEHRLYFSSAVTPGYISTIVNDTTFFENVYSGVKSIKETTITAQSQQVRKFALQNLQLIIGMQNLRIEKSEGGVPVIFNDSEQLPIPISLAHHDDWIAYSFIL